MRDISLPGVSAMNEQGQDVDNALVAVPMGTSPGMIGKPVAMVPAMFKNNRVQGKMQAGGPPIHVMTGDRVKAMWAAREAPLIELLCGLR